MSSTSRTGLVPAQKRKIKLVPKHQASIDRMPDKFEAIPMALVLRPFGGLYNPFAKGCSVLCNHPAPSGVRNMINQLRSSLVVDGKSLRQSKEHAGLLSHLNGTDNIPEDLFRRYTDTDSRPLTPTPTVTSVHTRNSAGSFLNNRRCITPELGKHEIIKRKKIILDLRRTHSQETLYWKPSSDLSQTATDLADGKAKSASAFEEKKTKRQKPDDQRPKSALGNSTAIGAIGEIQEEPAVQKVMPQTCINEQRWDDEDIRRGKKRKKLKPPTTTTTFHLSEDPETQVATLGPDSLNPSTRPSLIPNSISLLPGKEKRESEPVLLKGSYLTDDAFQALKTELDVDVIENTFDRYLNRALREAIKYIPAKPKTLNEITQEIEKLSLVTQSKLPRKFSKSATRFDVPLDPQLLEDMSVLTYVSQYVWVSRQRKQLYKRVFLKYVYRQMSETMEAAAPAENSNSKTCNNNNNNGNKNNTNNSNTEEDSVALPLREYVERTISMECLPKALEDVLEFYGTERNISEVLRLLDFEAVKCTQIDFRTWCGVVSLAERLALESPSATDSCDELEKADFSSLEQRLEFFTIPENLQQVFKIIRSGHNVRK